MPVKAGIQFLAQIDAMIEYLDATSRKKRAAGMTEF
jgi:hypothetical protein